MPNIKKDNNNFEELNFEEDDMMTIEQRSDYELAKLRDLELKTRESIFNGGETVEDYAIQFKGDLI
tara:strand:+ start:64 stop:261 length:198 start_codon:yes stop_codon:yes gene_type:complete